MSKPDNPFFTGIQIPNDYFCDREKETAELIRLIENGNNIVLKAQRRIGKSSLVNHVFNQKEVKSRYNTLYVDIFGTKSLDDFHVAFQNKLLAAGFAKSAKIKRDFNSMLKSLKISLGEYNPVTGAIALPSIGSSPSQLPRIPMEDLFSFLESTKKPNVVVFDEFQQIQYYPERMAAILRSFVQGMNNTRFIFSGSSSHMLTAMFQLANQPFYKSAQTYEIDVLDLDVYTEFCKKNFRKNAKDVSADAVEFLYYCFSGETAPMQEIMNLVFIKTLEGSTADVDTVKCAVAELLDKRDMSYREILNRLEKENVRNTLYCIAALGIGSGLTSSKTMKYYHLDNASSVQKALLLLQDENYPLIRKISKGTYVIDDRLFELWIAREGNYLEIKYSVAKERFRMQRTLETPSFNPTKPC